MSSDEPSYQEKLDQLQKDYVANLPGRIAAIEQSWQEYNEAGWEPASLKQLHLHIHSMAGSAATFGFLTLGNLARTTEQVLKPLLNSDIRPTQKQHLELAGYISELLDDRQSVDCKISPIGSLQGESGTISDIPLIYILEDDEATAKSLDLQLASYGYKVKIFSNTRSLDTCISDNIPDLFIADIILHHEFIGGTKFFQTMHGDTEIPTIFCSALDDFEARLEAVRAGADAYFVKPVEVDLLVDKMDLLLKRKPKKPYQILLVDDDIAIAEHYSLIMTHVGYQVKTVTKPEDLLTVLSDFSPDLIIMDLYMPECSGSELTKVIRQQPAYDSIPIVYLSTESDTDKQLSAMRMGGSEFISKPVQDNHFLTAVSIRVERARKINELIMKDSLTGLVKHARMKEQLAIEVARAARSKSNFAFVMIDIDLFKNINDTHGHLTGDRVIKNLAQFLRKRLRQNDIIARYGGEEFAIILEDCGREDAVALIDSIRDDFSRLIHYASDKEIQVTFSAGIAFSADHSIAEELNLAADKALYQAKTEGRNRVAS